MDASETIVREEKPKFDNERAWRGSFSATKQSELFLGIYFSSTSSSLYAYVLLIILSIPMKVRYNIRI